MDLESFIAETLRQIVKGVKTAQSHVDCKGARINPDTIENKPAGQTLYRGERIERIEFDVAVTVSEGKEKQGKGSIGVASILGVAGQASSTASSSSVSRIKFEIPLIFPVQHAG
jgi:hypothetical protein